MEILRDCISVGIGPKELHERLLSRPVVPTRGDMAEYVQRLRQSPCVFGRWFCLVAVDLYWPKHVYSEVEIGTLDYGFQLGLSGCPADALPRNLGSCFFRGRFFGH